VQNGSINSVAIGRLDDIFIDPGECGSDPVVTIYKEGTAFRISLPVVLGK